MRSPCFQTLGTEGAAFGFGVTEGALCSALISVGEAVCGDCAGCCGGDCSGDLRSEGGFTCFSGGGGGGSGILLPRILFHNFLNLLPAFFRGFSNFFPAAPRPAPNAAPTIVSFAMSVVASFMSFSPR